MHGIAALRPDFEPGLPRALEFTDAERLETRLRDRVELERLRKQTDTDLTELKAAEVWLARRLKESAPDDLDPGWLAKAAEQAKEKEREAKAHFPPVLAALKDALDPPRDRFDADVQQLLRDGIVVLEGWLAFYVDLRQCSLGKPQSGRAQVRYCALVRSKAMSITPS